MHSKYIKLFEELSKSIAVTAEQVMDYNKSKNDETGYNNSLKMRDDYQLLADSIHAAGDNYVLNHNDAAKLAVGAMIIVNQLQDKVTFLQKAISSYQTDIIPKLKDIVDNAKDDEQAVQMSNDKFDIKEEN